VTNTSILLVESELRHAWGQLSGQFCFREKSQLRQREMLCCQTDFEVVLDIQGRILSSGRQECCFVREILI